MVISSSQFNTDDAKEQSLQNTRCVVCVLVFLVLSAGARTAVARVRHLQEQLLPGKYPGCTGPN